MKINPGARFGMAVPIAAEVRLIPLRNKDWNKVTLHKIIHTNDQINNMDSSVLLHT